MRASCERGVNTVWPTFQCTPSDPEIVSFSIYAVVSMQSERENFRGTKKTPKMTVLGAPPCSEGATPQSRSLDLSSAGAWPPITPIARGNRHLAGEGHAPKLSPLGVRVRKPAPDPAADCRGDALPSLDAYAAGTGRACLRARGRAEQLHRERGRAGLPAEYENVTTNIRTLQFCESSLLSLHSFHSFCSLGYFVHSGTLPY